MAKDKEHTFIREMECAKNKFDFNLCVHELLIDFKVLLKEYYAATFLDDGNALIMNFTNGQKFILTLQEIK